MPNRDEILRELIVETLRGVLADDNILIQNILKYNGPFNFDDPRHIPDKGYVDAQLGSASSPPIEITGPGIAGVYDLSSYLSGTQTIARVTVNGIGVGFDNNDPSAIYDYYVSAGASDVVRFYVLGQPLPPPAPPSTIPAASELIVLNNSSQNVGVNFNSSSVSPILPGGNIDEMFLSYYGFYIEWPIGTIRTLRIYDEFGGQVGPTITSPNPPNNSESFSTLLDVTKGYLFEIIDT